MLNKRTAIKAIFMGLMAKMAKADEPPVTSPPPKLEKGIALTLRIDDRPKTWTVNLDMMFELKVIRGGQEVVITSAELFEALKG